MSDTTIGEVPEPSEGVARDPRRRPYEAPKLTRLGNARELLAGNSGSIDDMNPTPRLRTQSST
jgi:hypothetical protein